MFILGQIRAVCTISGIPYKAPADYEHFKTNKEVAFRAKFPHGKIPAWEEDDFFLSEGDAILRYGAFDNIRLICV